MPRWEIQKAYKWDFAHKIPDRKLDLAKRDDEKMKVLIDQEWEPFSAVPDLAENATVCTIVWFKRQVMDA